MSAVCGIYSIRNTVDGKRYIGQSINVAKRLQEHRRKMAAKTHYNYRLKLAVSEFGLDAFEFELVEEVPQDLLDVREISWISYFNTTDPKYGYNLTTGGYSHVPSAETRAKIAASLRGVPHSEARRRKESEAHKGFCMPEDTKLKLSKALRGRPKPPRTKEHARKIAAANRGRKQDPEVVAKRAARMRGRVVSEETRRKLSEAMLARYAKLRAQKDEEAA